MSTVPLINEAIPVPDPPPVTAMLTDGSTFRAGAPVSLFDASRSEGGDVLLDGQRALMIFPADQNTIDPLTLVINWTADLDRD